MKYAQPSVREFPARDQGCDDLDPGTLSAALREVTLRAHKLVGSSTDRSSLNADAHDRASRKYTAKYSVFNAVSTHTGSTTWPHTSQGECHGALRSSWRKLVKPAGNRQQRFGSSNE